ncbi:MAG: hypothetical protein LBH13_08990 [Cellulomonadaceae bacterium]|nr:hypothetical protein [Cellulomonadaceae bacterium]
MTITVKNMMYVSNPAECVAFWIAAGAEELARQTIPFGNTATETVQLAFPGNPGAVLQFWDVEFIRAASPEVADSRPSLLLCVESLTELHAFHARIATLTDTASPVHEEMGMFNFADPSGTYFAVQVAAPA